MDEVQQAPPVTLERGRYRLVQEPDGGIALARVVGICETCQRCGCGDKTPQINIPAAMLKLAGSPLMGKFRAMLGGGQAVSIDE